MFFIDFLQFGWNTGDGFGGILWKKCFGHDGAVLQFIFNKKKTERLEIASPFISDYQNRVLTYFLGQNGPETKLKNRQKIVKKIGVRNQKRQTHIFFESQKLSQMSPT